jgi:large subunit ribosomal protein L17
VKLRKLGRRSDHRRMLLRNQVTSLILHDRIETTEAKAKTIKPLVDKMVTLGKRGESTPAMRAIYLDTPL